MTEDFLIRKANKEDIIFLTEAIIGAEKSNTEKLGLSTLFNLTENRIKEILIEILNEEVDGCEFSISSFFIAEFNRMKVAAVGGWIEAFYDEIPSQSLKANLIRFRFPQESIEFLKSKLSIIEGIQIKRDILSLQIEYVYVSQCCRGKRLAEYLIKEHIRNAKLSYSALNKVQVQVFKNNYAAIKLYERLGFTIIKEFKSKNDNALDYLPYNEKLLMEKKIDNNGKQ
jgi:ribosomal protein S18 acetylase RimI-like enzyme